MEHLQDDRLKRQRDDANHHVPIDDDPLPFDCYNNPITSTTSTESTDGITTTSSSSSSDSISNNHHITKVNPHHNELFPEQISRHYACPPTKLHELRKRYGTNKNEWGDWSRQTTRAFYRTNLPRALQIDGALGLTLEERAKLASEARHALRIYARERCFLVGFLISSNTLSHTLEPLKHPLEHITSSSRIYARERCFLEVL